MNIEAKTVDESQVETVHLVMPCHLNGARNGDMIVIKGKLTWVGSSSMEVCVDTYVENRQGDRERINNAHFMMVALDDNDHPAQVPRLILQTEDEKLAWSHGEERRRIRIQRRKNQLDWS